MKNPKLICSHCSSLHANPLIDLFNKLIEHWWSGKELPERVELDLYRAYMTGMHDILWIIFKLSEAEQEQAEGMLNSLGIQLREAVIGGMVDMPAELKVEVQREITQRFFLRETCHGN